MCLINRCRVIDGLTCSLYNAVFDFIRTVIYCHQMIVVSVNLNVIGFSITFVHLSTCELKY